MDDSLSCGSSIYNPDTSDRDIVECEVIISELGVTKLKEVIGDNEMWLYISILGGGCSGYVYDLELRDERPSDEYQIIKQDEIGVAVHNFDSTLINGILLDFSEKLMGGGFHISNPNATKTCSCGISFR